jgi:hypothetical protein
MNEITEVAREPRGGLKSEPAKPERGIKKQTEDAAYRVYEYGARGFSSRIDDRAAIEQLHLRNELWNELVAIERNAQRQYQETALGPILFAQLTSIQEEIDALIRMRSQSAPSKKAALSDEIDRLFGVRRDLFECAKLERKQRRAEVLPLLRAIEEKRKAAVREAIRQLATGGLFHWVSDAAKSDFDAARSRAIKDHVQLRFHHFRGEGTVAVRYQNGLPVPKALDGSDGRFQLDPVPAEAFDPIIVRSQRRKLQRTHARIRIGSHPDRSPIWLELPIMMHRPLPANGVIRQVKAKRERIANQTRWKICVVVDESQVAGLESERLFRDQRVLVEVAWEPGPDESIVAALYAPECCNTLLAELESETLILDRQLLHGLRLAEDLAEIRQKYFNEIKEFLVAWIKTHGSEHWMGDVARLANWSAAVRIIRLMREMPEDAPEDLRRALGEWRKRDFHLWTYERNLRDQSERRRREQYRIWARQLMNRYSGIVMRDRQLHIVATDPNEDKMARARRKLVAPSLLTTILAAAAGKNFELVQSEKGEEHERTLCVSRAQSVPC